MEYALSVLKLADLEKRQNHRESAETLYARAAQILAGRPEAAPALIGLGKLALGVKEWDQAYDYFRQAQAADKAQAGSALMWMAVARERQGKPDEAETLYGSALAVMDPNSADAAPATRLYASLLRAKGSSADLEALDERARALGKRVKTEPVPAGVYRMGAGIASPTVAQKSEPQYTEEARAAKLQGPVLLTIEIAPDGRAHNIQVRQSLGLGLDETAADAVSQWVFKPDGVPVTVLANVEVNFRLL